MQRSIMGEIEFNLNEKFCKNKKKKYKVLYNLLLNQVSYK